ncbi:transmembrane protein 192-like [Varroa jacobsoni]|uniref:Transmembrane protein 192 n=1 Tax=Varroa destructor TaxID=109461 RepID=A0A7M7J5E3_VARDE|nr:transmembrane protein 192-like isoform X2 [Varroa destructor]XP_022706918.1 transmembrane protein 192-like [Varroa jacobsoni]
MARIDGYDNFSGQSLPEQAASGDNEIAFNAVEDVDNDAARLCAALDPPDNRVETSAVISFQIIYMVGLLVLSFVLPYVPHLPMAVYSLIVYLHCVVWALSYILDAYLRKQHTLLSCYGFIDFYQKSKNLRRITLNLMSSGTIMMLIVSVLIADYCVDRLRCPPNIASYIYLQAIITLETIIIVPVLMYYLKLSCEFHRNKLQPEIEPQDFITSILQAQTSAEIGYRDNGPLEDIVEKQSDMIRYLKKYNTFLKRKVLRLSQELEIAREESLLNV